MRKDFSDRFLENPQKLSTDSKSWNLGLGLSASAYTTIKFVIELMDADLLSLLSVSSLPESMMCRFNRRCIPFFLLVLSR